MKKEFKIMCGIALAAAFLGAGRASAEIAVGIDPAAYVPAHAGWSAVSRASAERLGAVADRLSAAAGSGDAAGSEAQFASFYSGSALKGGPAPVYTAALPAAAVPAVAAPLPARPAPVRFAKSASESLEVLADAGISAEASSPAKADKADTEDSEEQGGKDEEPQDKLWETALAFAIGVAFVLLIICLV